MRRVAIFIILLFALFTLINAYTSERIPDSKSPISPPGVENTKN